ncbi:carbamoyl-phosphate synthase large subunit [Salegentibacter agarivorans]|uniref:Carbamoyl-phosphate synthase large subunit n=1 Tax=Salegentibacter agarivorans TaxID=345907 RepID=A0A1I2K021_9FLAO|nr:ATP-grasp domain-containing protein [Salegentibacter agarivorans]SFF60174.1 carbamoyl-phosphate synthase large subunit [Salegentibacter agarivorans]
MNVLLTSAGRRTYLVEYFKQALKGKGIVYASNSTFSSALNIADDFVITPLIYEESYIPFLLSFVKKKKISVIISLFDIDLPVLAKAKDLFKKNGVTVIVSDYEVTQICNDKWSSYNFLIENGFNTPKTYIDYGEAQNDFKKNILAFPLIIKPRWGMGSIGIYKAENQLELEVFYKKVKKEIEESYLQFESKAQIDRAILIQECINGEEYGLDIFNDLDGKYLKTFVKKKTAMRSGETDSSVTENHQELQELGKKLSEKLKHIGNLDSDWFITTDQLYVLEMNCRFGGGYPFTHLAGANLPKVLIDLIQSHVYNPEDLYMEYEVEMIKDIQPVKIKKQ